MTATPRVGLEEGRRAGLSPAAAVAGVALCMLSVFAVFWSTTSSMIVIWRTNTFEHCFLVVPIFLWLVWRDGPRLAAIEPRSFWPALGLLALFGFAWLAAQLGGVSAVAHLAMVAMIPASVLLVFGAAWFRILLFPLAFLFFAVPLGDALIPWLVDRTADFTVAALRLTGVPVYRESAHFVIPSGKWSVVEACSGVRFLIASVMAGSLYAWLMYRSTLRRMLFLLASVVAPIVANWIRAYVTVLIAHLSNNQWMAGDEHITFGRILFSAVLLVMFWVGARWREDDKEDAELRAPAYAPAVSHAHGLRVRTAAGFTAMLFFLACWPLAAHWLLETGDRRPVRVVPMKAASGWTETPEPIAQWSPSLQLPAATHSQAFEQEGRRVGVFLGVYRNQDDKSKLASSYNRLIASENRQWRQLREYTATTDVPSFNGSVLGGQLRGRDGDLLVWHWYWLGDHVTTSAVRARIDLAWARLTRTGDTSAWVAIFTPVGETPTEAETTLATFLRDNAGNLDAALRATAAQ